jgi:hypothetical protein
MHASGNNDTAEMTDAGPWPHALADGPTVSLAARTECAEAPADRLSLGVPAVPRLAQLEAQQFDQFEQTFSQLTVDERFLSLSALAQRDFPKAALDTWVSSSDSFIAPLFLGTAILYRAWQVRGGRVATEVPAETFDAFEAHA